MHLASLCFWAWLALQDPAPDKEAAALFEKLERRVGAAKSLHVKFREEGYGVDAKVKEGGRFVLSLLDRPEAAFVRRCDGLRTIETGRVHYAEEPASEAALRDLRRTLVDGDAARSIASRVTGRRNVRSGGRERVGTVDTAIVAYEVVFEEEDLVAGVKLWVDPDRLTVLRRTLVMGGATFDHEMQRWAYDEPLDDALFVHHSKETLAAGRARQVARSVELFARYTGRLPRTPEDLVRRPDWVRADAFWPEGGFWIGAAPTDVALAHKGFTVQVGDVTIGPAEARAIAAPTERLAKHYAARVRGALVAAAVEAFRVSTMRLPDSIEDLSRKPPWATVWPEAGFLQAPSPGVTIAPDGTGLRIVSGATPLDPNTLMPEESSAPAVDLRPEESARIERTIANLGASEIEAREKAMDDLLLLGGLAKDAVERRVGVERDPEMAARLAAVRTLLIRRPPEWRRELAAPSFLVRSCAASGLGPHQSEEAAKLLFGGEFWSGVQKSYIRAAGRRGNWVRDIAGLYGMVLPGRTEPLRMMFEDVAYADASPNRGKYPALSRHDAPEPRQGYFFSVLDCFESEEGAIVPYEGSLGTHKTRFGYAAWPADYGTTGRLTFIVNEKDKVWSKDTGGVRITTFPRDPRAHGWRRVE